VDVTTMKHKPKNVEGLLFKEQEAGYLVGYAAAVGEVEGRDCGRVGRRPEDPPVDRYIAGFQFRGEEGRSRPEDADDYSRISSCRRSAGEGAQPDRQGSVVEFQVAGQCGLGVLDAARSKGVFGIGVDADQGYLGRTS